MPLYVAVLQQHEALGGNTACGGAVLFGEDVAGGPVQVAVFIGIVKEPQFILGFEDAAASCVEESAPSWAVVRTAA